MTDQSTDLSADLSADLSTDSATDSATETARLARLHALAVLDTEPEPLFDTFTRMAALICGTPMALISLVDSERQWFKSRVGLDVQQTPRDQAFCAHAILGDALFEVADARSDSRFADNPQVTGASGIRFYAGAPIVMPGGERIGTLCVVDQQPRALNTTQRAQLTLLSQAVMQALLIRESALTQAWLGRSRLEAALGDEVHALAAAQQRLASLVHASGDAIVSSNLDGVIEDWNPAAERLFGHSAQQAIGRAVEQLFPWAPAGPALRRLALPQAEQAAAPFEASCRHRLGREVQVSVGLTPITDREGRVCGLSLVLRDISALKAAERALLDGERKFRILSDASPVGVFHTDADGRCTYTNASWRDIYGLSLAQSLGDEWASAVHPDDQARVLAAWRSATGPASGQRGAESANSDNRDNGDSAAIDTTGFEQDFRILRSDGRVRQIHSRSRSITDDSGNITGYVGVVEDTTDRHLAQARLRASEALLERTERIAKMGGWTLDLQNQALHWSDQTCRIHDRLPGHQPTLDEALGHYTAQSRPLMEQAVQTAMGGGAGWDLELPLVTAQGRAIWVRAQGEVDFEDGQPVRLSGAFQDISARRQAEAALLESRQLLRVLYEATPAMLQSIDPAGQLLTASDVWLSTLGYQRAQVIGRPATDFFVAASRLPFAELTLPALWRNGAVDQVPLQMQHHSGAPRDVLLSAVLDRDAAGSPRRALILIVDVTEDLARQAELKREQALRQQIQRHADDLKSLLEERSDMLNVLAHEVRQPLNNASAALQSASASLLSQGEQAASARLQRAQNVMAQVLAGIDNTLAAASLLSGASPLEWQDTDIDTLISVSVADLPVNERKRISVQRDTTTRTASMDMGLLRLALRNLLANALKYSPANSVVRLQITESDRPLALILEVSDQGKGFEAELLPRLFERGAHGSKGGHGLGLHIVRRVMDLHEGRVELVRNTAQGSTLRLVIAQHLA